MQQYKLSLDRGILSQIMDKSFVQKYFQNIKSTDCKHITLDLNNISFVDSACITFIVKLYKYCKKQNKQFSLVNLGDDVKDILHKVNIDRVIPIEVS